ncbi:MAG TPA: hypothetical protein VH061_14020 [Solirubrobacteraceae bacterium]|jgi:hypothetical protein|nr:hypothetical protein [Solirubrobacteraceae bacterium]
MRRTKTVIAASAALALVLPAAAPAKLTEVGVIGTTTPATVASCPASPCLAVSRTTGFQVKVGTIHNPMGITRNGTVVAWTITLGKPSTTQIKFFDTNEGGVSEAGIAVLRPQPKPNLTYKLIASSPLVKLQPYFGKTAQFALETTIPVKKGDELALTVPTWAPALALGFGNDTSWRASRPKKQCTTTSSQTAQTQIAASVQYYCLYQTARLTYSATLISTP